MPHIHLEYSENCRPDGSFADLFQQIHSTLSKVGGIKLSNCKSRASCQKDYFIADGDPSHAFAHLSIRFVTGRSDSIKTQIGANCMEHLKLFFRKQINESNLQITVEVRDIQLKNYHKHPEGTLTSQQ
ncbi:MAG: hypothetical protein KTR18_00105 [Acidiferrobacterales bacterium]|nr:hypothetical protein [Acidiferrobacterales bacterium]